MCAQILTAAGALVTASSSATAVTASSAVGSVAGHTAPQTTHRRSGAGTAGHRSSHADTRADISAQAHWSRPPSHNVRDVASRLAHTSWTLMLKKPLRFLYISALSDPGDWIAMWVQSMAPMMPGILDRLYKACIVCGCSSTVSGNLTYFLRSDSIVAVTLCTVLQTVDLLMLKVSPTTSWNDPVA